MAQEVAAPLEVRCSLCRSVGVGPGWSNDQQIRSAPMVSGQLIDSIVSDPQLVQRQKLLYITLTHVQTFCPSGRRRSRLCCLAKSFFSASRLFHSAEGWLLMDAMNFQPLHSHGIWVDVGGDVVGSSLHHNQSVATRAMTLLMLLGSCDVFVCHSPAQSSTRS